MLKNKGSIIFGVILVLLVFNQLKAEAANGQVTDIKLNPENKTDKDVPGYQNQNNQSIQTVVVKGDVFSEKDSAYTINVVDRKKIEEKGLTRAADILEEIPGIKITEYNQGGISNAVAIRGFDSGVHGGDMGVYLDGIPLNEYYGHGGGYAEPNVIIPVELDRVLVYKGPSSSLYGNFSRGGTLAYFTRKKDVYDVLSLKYGSYDTYDAQFAMGNKIADNLWNNTALQIYSAKGFSDNSAQFFGNASTKFIFNLDKFDISLSLRAHSDDWDSPSYITRTQWDGGDKYKQAPGGENDGGWRRQFSERLDVAYSFSNSLKAMLWAFSLQSDWARFAKYTSASTQVETNNDLYKAGTGANLNYKTQMVNAIAGFEFVRDATHYEKYDTVERVRQNMTTDIDTTFDNYALFAELEIKPLKYLRPFVGARYDMFAGEEKNRLTGSDNTFAASDYTHLSPKFGIRSTVIDKLLDLRVNISNGYMLPPAEALHNAQDKRFDPAEIWQYELGATIQSGSIFWLDVCGYIIDTKDEIQQLPDDSFANYGKTRRQGIETELKIKPVQIVELSGGFSYTDTEVKKSVNASIEGKHITTVPETMANAGLRVILPYGLILFGKFIHVGKSYVSEDNTETYNGYNLFNAGVAYKHKNDKNSSVTFEVKNIANAHYATFASGSDYWSTGMPRSYWLSMNLKW